MRSAVTFRRGIRMKLSVVMVTYNHEKFIAQAIESILAQRVNFDYEIVIGEDLSTDNTRAIVLDFARRYPERIRTLSRDRNIGAMRNFVQTIAACRGQYLAFLEGDDYWTSPDKLQKQVDFLDAHYECAICCHKVRYLYELGSAEFDIFPTRASGKYTIEDLLKSNFVMTCSMVLRRELIGPIPKWIFHMKLGDLPICALAARHGTIELMDENMATYRVHAGGTWSSLPSMTRLREGSRVLRALDKHLGYQYSKTIRQTIAPAYLNMAEAARLNGERIQTARYLMSCLRNGGWLLPGKQRVLAGLGAYVLMGSWYKMFSRVKSLGDGL
jgi:glycosyltransferase involved in cell wall biosynthesis